MITEQRKKFIDEYLKLRCKNQTEAAILAGYSPKSASSQASQLLSNPKVQEYLNERKSQLTKELQQEFIYDALEARKVMYEILNREDAADKDRITVARDFLDRAGFKPSDKLELSGEVKTNPFEGLTEAELRRLAGDDSND